MGENWTFHDFNLQACFSHEIVESCSHVNIIRVKWSRRKNGKCLKIFFAELINLLGGKSENSFWLYYWHCAILWHELRSCSTCQTVKNDLDTFPPSWVIVDIFVQHLQQLTEQKRFSVALKNVFPSFQQKNLYFSFRLFDIIERISVAREMNIIFERKTVTWSMRSLAKNYSSLTHYLEHTRETHKLAARRSTFMGRKWMSLKRLAIDQSISETVRSLWKIWKEAKCVLIFILRNNSFKMKNIHIFFSCVPCKMPLNGSSSSNRTALFFDHLKFFECLFSSWLVDRECRSREIYEKLSSKLSPKILAW